MSIKIKSARFPGSKLPVISPICSALAPMLVAIASEILAGRAVGSSLTALETKLANRISSIISRSLLEAGPSVPMPTLTPSSIMRWTGAKPEASLRLEEGLCAIPAPACCRERISPSSRCTQWAAISLVSSIPNLRI